MAMLLDLPNELLLQVLDSATPTGMVSFATSCKRVNKLAQDNLTLHQQRIVKYQDVTLWGCFRHQDQPHPIILLRDICKDWRVAYYAKSLVIECCGRDQNLMDSYWEGRSQASLIAQDAETVESILPEITIPVRKMLSVALRWDEAKVNDVLDMTKHGARGAILGLLLVSLPAIKSISFNDYVWRDRLWIDSMQSITDQQDPHSAGSEPKFLMEVSELNLDDQKEGHSVGMSCSVVPFVILPSLRVIRGVSISSASYNEYSFDGHHGRGPSHVTEIDLQRSSLDAERLGGMLGYMPALKRFRFDQGRHNDISGGAEPGSIINGLLACASSSLESLSLTGATAHSGRNARDIKGPLKDFKVLKNIHLPSSVFRTYNKLFSEPRDIPRLVDVLPASIETVRLDGDINTGATALLLTGLPEGKADFLPKLKEIVFFMVVWVRYKPSVEALANLRQKQGIALQLDKVTKVAHYYSGRFLF